MNNQNLKLCLVQSDIVWEDIEQNLQHLDILISGINGSPDIILLPEMFTTGFTMNSKKLAEGNDGEAFQWMRSKASEINAAIAGTIIYREDGKIYNRMLWVNPDGQWFSYDKRHLFSMGGEDKHYSKGDKRMIINFRGWKICPLICYDLRFPVFSRNNEGFDLLVYFANWPAARNHVWQILLKARAIENQCYVAGVNRVGRDGENIHYNGESCVIHPKGFYVNCHHEPKEMLLEASINYSELQEFRAKFLVLGDADDLSELSFLK
ncbi:MAG: amidohydrolase [Bacteroidales bacterium]|nr:amidohydrolase [Bacteroidales bacterium]